MYPYIVEPSLKREKVGSRCFLLSKSPNYRSQLRADVFFSNASSEMFPFKRGFLVTLLLLYLGGFDCGGTRLELILTGTCRHLSLACQ